MHTADYFLKKVNRYINKISYTRKPQSLYIPIKYVLNIGGKRIRPILMLLSYNLYKDDAEKIISTACAIETYHNYTLLHDDLMDEAPIRRGKPTVHTKWNANQAILSGDSMLVLAYKFLINCSQKHLSKCLNLFTDTALEIGEGQQYDMEFENRTDVTVDEYINMIRLKTSVLLACAMKIGAILANATDEDAENLYKFGEQIGIAFQLQDDYLDVYGDPKVFGKKIGGDIISNKKTYMLITAFEKANSNQLAELNKWINKKKFNHAEKIAVIRSIYDEIGVNEFAKYMIDYYYKEGQKYLAKVNVPINRKLPLETYIEEMMKRQK